MDLMNPIVMELWSDIRSLFMVDAAPYRLMFWRLREVLFQNLYVIFCQHSFLWKVIPTWRVPVQSYENEVYTRH